MNISLSPKNTAFIAKYAALTGYTQEEFASMFLADYLGSIGDGPSDSGLQETIGSMYFKDKESAARVQAWLIKRVSKRHSLNSIETRINRNKDGTFDVKMSVPDPFESGGRYHIS